MSTGPVLYDTVVGGQPRKAIAVARTDGYFFHLDRETGKPVLPIEERAVKQDARMKTSPTQPFPVNADRVGPGCALREQVPEGWVTGCYFNPIGPDMPNVFMPHMNLRRHPWRSALRPASCMRPHASARNGFGGRRIPGSSSLPTEFRASRSTAYWPRSIHAPTRSPGSGRCRMPSAPGAGPRSLAAD